MTYTFKLARRLAVSRTLGMLPAILLFAACSGDATAPESPTASQDDWRSRNAVPVSVRVNPSNVTVETNQLIRFLAYGHDSAGNRVYAPIAWSATGGTILPDGRFSSAAVGTFRVMGGTRVMGSTRDRREQRLGTSMVRVVLRQPHLRTIEIAPGSATLAPGVTQSFVATGRLKDGRPVSVGVVWRATGGAIDAGGNYVAGDTAGTYLVTATNTTRTIADTAIVTITAPPPPPPPPATSPPADTTTPPTPPTTPPADTTTPPTPTLAQVMLLPASATLAPSATRQFTAYGRTTAGDSVAVNVVFAANGGTVTQAGLYTAGSSAGTFRVIASDGVLADTSVVTVSAPLGSGPSAGVPFGPFELWGTSFSQPAWGPAPFTMSINADSPDGIITRINAARMRGHKLVLMMTSGNHTRYITNEKFDLAKWKARMDLYNTTAIKAAVAAGVADGTILGADMLDEPQHVSWGGVITKPMLDGMAAYVKGIFPTVPVGISTRLDWRSSERFTRIDFVATQYVSSYGSITVWRDKALAGARENGVAVVFSINILNGGAGFGETSCPIPQTGGDGYSAGRCRMSPTQVRDFGMALGSAGSGLLMWQFDATFMSNPDNQVALKDIAAHLATLPAKSWRRP